jgi:hypothetical protein
MRRMRTSNSSAILPDAVPHPFATSEPSHARKFTSFLTLLMIPESGTAKSVAIVHLSEILID